MIHRDILCVPGHEVPLNQPLHPLLDILSRHWKAAQTHDLAAQGAVKDTLATLHDAHDQRVQYVGTVTNDLKE